MIEAKETLIGGITSSSTLKGSLNKAVEYISPVTQEKVVKPSLDVQEVTPDSEYTGLSKVTVEAVKLQNKTVSPTSEEQTITSDDDFIGLNEVKVNAISNEYIKPTGTLDINANGEYDVKEYEKANVNISSNIEITSCQYLFYNGARADYMNEICALISPSCQRYENMFYQNRNMLELPPFDTSNGTNFSYMIVYCSGLTKLSLNTSKGKNFNHMCNGCTSLAEISQLDMGSANSLSSMLASCSALTTLGGFKDLGKAYTSSTVNYSSYKLDLSSATKLTHESLMNVINNLWDLAGNNQKSQSLVLGSTNLAKLTEEEIAIATNKGWNVS